MRDSFDWTILDRKLAGDTSPSDEAALDEWLRADPSRARLVEALIAERGRRARAEPEWDLDALRQRIDDRTSPRPLQARRSPPRVPALNLLPSSRQLSTRMPMWRAAGIAAAVVIAVGSGLLLRRAQLQQPQGAGRDQAAREYTTTRGQLASIYLTDGTRVVLAPDSRLKVPADIGDVSASAAHATTREVNLEGAAYFEVVHDTRRPFAVRTSAGIARDIGTEFEVRAYERTRPMQVTVVSGTVSLHGITDPTPVVSLGRGDRATLSATGVLNVVHDVNLAPVVGWTKGTLIFQGAPLNEVAVELSRWYDLEVRVADTALRNRRLVLSIGDEPASDALNLIALSLDLRVDRRGRVVTLSQANHGK